MKRNNKHDKNKLQNYKDEKHHKNNQQHNSL